jgi:hypothetical protein
LIRSSSGAKNRASSATKRRSSIHIYFF